MAFILAPPWRPRQPQPRPGLWEKFAAIRWRCCLFADTISAIISGIGSVSENAHEPPLIFNVNWFRKGANGKFLWPGFGENMRVLKWVIDRCEQNAGAVKSPVGWLPSPHDLDLDGLDIDHKSVADSRHGSRGMAKRTRRAQNILRLAWRRGSGGVARTARAARGAVR